MKLREIARIRLCNQQIANSHYDNAIDLLEWMGAVQAQEYAYTKWALGLRLKETNGGAIEKLFNDGKMLRTHLLRPTWHFVSARDIGWMLQLTARRVHAANAFMYRKLELDKDIFKRCIKVLESILRDGTQLTRKEINEEFRKNKIIAEGHRLSYLMMYAELEAIICSGARLGNQFTYSLLDGRIRTSKKHGRDDALMELSKRYFQSRGPATIKDFSIWSGLTVTDCKRGVEIMGDYLRKQIVNRMDYYLADEGHMRSKRTNKVSLLPIYDEFIMGYKDRSATMEYKNALKKSKSFLFDNMIVQDGQIIGTWKRTIGKKAIDLDYQFFTTPTGMQRSRFQKAVQHFQEFHGQTVNCKDENS